MPAGLRVHALAAKGFMPPDEGDALYAAAIDAAAAVPGLPLLEVGSYCGRSTVWLGAAARAAGTIVYAVDHHHGSEENQAGWEHHDPTVVDARTGRMDTLPTFRATIDDAGLEDVVVGVVGRSAIVAVHWRTPVALLFIDGGHGVRAGPRRLRRVDAARRPRRHAGDPRRVPRSGRRRPPAVRGDLPAGVGQRALRRARRARQPADPHPRTLTVDAQHAAAAAAGPGG